MDKKINYQARRSNAMARQLSYSKYEQELRPELRQNMNIAESTEDVKKFFVYTIQKLFGRVLERKGAFTYEDIRLDPQEQSGFIISDKLLEDPDFAAVWRNSDLANIVKRIADAASNRHRHLQKNPAKTESKICQAP
jgi:hypothetical protein